MTFEAYIKAFRGVGDDELHLFGLTKEQRMKYEKFIGETQAARPYTQGEQLVQAYYAANPDERPVGSLMVKEFLDI